MTTYRLTPTEQVTVTERSDEALVAEMEMAAGHTKLPPAHRHPAQDEHFEVLEGSIRAVIDGEERVVEAGGTIDIPRGVAHAMAAAGGAPARARWETRPALGTEDWWKAIDAEVRSHPGGKVPLPVLARRLREHPGVFELALPGPVGAVALRVLSMVPVR